MRYLKTTIRYLSWHFSLGYYHLSMIYKNVFFFLTDYFTIKSLIKEFFLPWKRLSSTYTNVKTISDFFQVLIQNTIMRFVGIILRATVLFVSLIVLILFIPVYPLVIILWTLSPFIIFSLIVSGIILIGSILIRI